MVGLIRQFWTPECAPLRWGVFFYIMVAALDLATTSLGMRVAGLYETNPLMRDPQTLRFILINGIWIKLASAVVLCLLPSVFMHRASDSYFCSSLPFWYWGFHTIPIVMGNLLLIWTTF